jgi:hypothetical protein
VNQRLKRRGRAPIPAWVVCRPPQQAPDSPSADCGGIRRRKRSSRNCARRQQVVTFSSVPRRIRGVRNPDSICQPPNNEELKAS